MDGYHPNAFLAKKLKTEGLLNDEEEVKTTAVKETKPKPAEDEMQTEPEITKEIPREIVEEANVDSSPSINEKIRDSPEKKRISDTSEESDTQVIIDKREMPSQIPEKILEIQEKIEKRKSAEGPVSHDQDSPPTKRKRSSPIVFDVEKKEKEKEREKEKENEKERERTRTESAGSDNHVIVTTTTNSHKYDSLPPCKLF